MYVLSCQATTTEPIISKEMAIRILGYLL